MKPDLTKKFMRLAVLSDMGYGVRLRVYTVSKDTIYYCVEYTEQNVGSGVQAHPLRLTRFAIPTDPSKPKRGLLIYGTALRWRPPFQDRLISDPRILEIKARILDALGFLGFRASHMDDDCEQLVTPRVLDYESATYRIIDNSWDEYVIEYVDRSKGEEIACRIPTEHAERFLWRHRITIWAGEVRWVTPGDSVTNQQMLETTVQRIQALVRQRRVRLKVQY